MKRIRFDELFLVSAIVIFIGTRKSITGSILLMLASLNMLVYVIPRIVKVLRHGKKTDIEE